MRIKVYHVRRESFPDVISLVSFNRDTIQKNATVQTYWALGQYELVAEVEVPNLERAFEVTNHIHNSWMMNPQVIACHGNRNHRSTSVGDVMELPDGTFRLVASFGFDEIKLEPYPA